MKTSFASLWKTVWKRRLVYAMMIPGIAWAILFCYMPMYGVVIAFKDYNPVQGVGASAWVGLKHFLSLFNGDFPRIMRNTLIISIGSFITGMPAPILFALMVSSIKNKAYRAITQTLSYVPYFVSSIVVAAMCFIFFAPTSGLINKLLRQAGLIEGSIGFLEDGPMFIVMLLIINVWKNTGFSAIIYFAAIAGVDPALYEAAKIDGARGWQRTWHITIPCILPTIFVQVILTLSSILDGGFDMQMVLANGMVWEWADVIDTYAYRFGLSKMRYSYGSAIGLFKSIVALILLVSTNRLSRKVSGFSLY